VHGRFFVIEFQYSAALPLSIVLAQSIAVFELNPVNLLFAT